MTSDHWQRVSKLYHDALARDASQRDAFVREACAGDEALRRAVESLLDLPAPADGFRDNPVTAVAAQMVSDAASALTGRRLGPYQVEARLGAGGMGEVYRARDLKLGRDVAIKILPRAFTSNPERLARFEREARVLAALNHQNIGAIFGLEDADGVPSLVLELVEGELLADRIALGPVPVKDALGMARQIADALDAAHEKGIVHRDLKPENIKVTPEGVVKVLDFGLAKAGGNESASDLTHSPTVTLGGTREGVILGTAAYMSPEQARGKVVDKRTDIWAFGCVLYQMLTGRAAFGGETVSDTIVAILDRQPDWRLLPSGTPASLTRLLQRCLEKDPKRRLHDIADARIEIEEALHEPSGLLSEVLSPGTLPSGAVTRARTSGLLVAAVVFALALGADIASRLAAPTSPVAPLARVMITLPAGQALEKGRFSPVALSPDGRLLAYAAAVGGGQTQLYLRALDELEARPIPATEGATTPFFSPDGRWLAFYSEASLKKVSLGGGVPLTISETPPIWSATWGGNNIVFATTLASTGLWQVSADGGEPVQVTTPKEGEALHGYPQFLPDTTHVLFSVLRDNAWRLAVLTLASRESKLLGGGRAVGEGAQYLPTGHIVYAQAGGLVATPFEPPDGDLNQPSIPLLERVERSRFGGAYFAVAPGAGSLVYLPANTAVTDRALLRVDRDGRVAPLLDARLGYEDPAFSPDGRRIAATIESDTGRDIWIIDVDRGTRIRFTTGGTSAFPVWSADGSRLAFQSTAPGPWNLYWKPIDGSAEAQPLFGASTQPAASWPNAASSLLPGTLPALSGGNPQFPMSWTSDGSMAFHERKPNGERDIWVVTPASEPTPFLLTPFDERSPRFSPDGKWLAYVSNESGRDEVYVQPFPGPGRKWLISTDGGIDPLWSRNGRELFYRQGEQMMVVSTVSTPDFSANRPRRLFETRFDAGDNGPNYDVAPDGKSFLMLRSERGPVAGELHLVLNWFKEVTARTPAAR
jgi:eukaryotic-like serine/threonine-protein kinase